MERNTLIEELKKVTTSLTKRVETFKQLTADELNYREDAESWSILECLEHLNRYGAFYLVEIEKKMLAAPEEKEATVFRTGWLGNYFVGLIKPKDGEIKKMKTLKNMDPLHSELINNSRV